MGAKCWMLVASTDPEAAFLSKQPALDERGTIALVSSLFPGAEPASPAADDLTSCSPGDGEIVAGRFEGAWIIAAEEFAGDRPSLLAEAFVAAAADKTLVLLARHSVVDWCAFAVWRGGQLLRSLSVSPDEGVIEDIGERLAFELPFWAGANPAGEAGDDYPLPFHPLELAEAANEHFLGFRIEGVQEDWHIEPWTVPMLRFTRGAAAVARSGSKTWWKFW